MHSLPALCVLLSACAGSSPSVRDPVASATSGPHLQTKLSGELWYQAPTRCGQGPYELELAALGARYGEGIELVIHAPRRVDITASLLVDGVKVFQASGIIGETPRGADMTRSVDNQRCIADVSEVSSAVHQPSGAPVAAPFTSPTVEPGAPVSSIPGAPSPSGDIRLIGVADPGTRLPGTSVIGFSWPQLAVGARVRIRLWSRAPNDLDGVSFYLMQTVETPSVPAAQYEAHLQGLEIERNRLAQVELDAETRRQRLEYERRERVALERQSAEDEARRQRESQPPPRRRTAAELEQRRLRLEVEEERYRVERERARIEREALLVKQREDSEKRRVKIALKIRRDAERRRSAEDKRRRRAVYCKSHLKDTSCWGAGGYRVSADLDKRAKERNTYCAANQKEARCWNAAEWGRRNDYYVERVADASRPPPEPTGPPPAPLAEAAPPKLSENAQWRPGYWYWTRDWVWISGVWRVPASDLEQELTTHAPEQPPVAKVETRPTAPSVGAIWVTGFWQWSGATWVWVKGSWQLPPSGQVTWRATSWAARGAVHVLVPGSWIEIGVGR